jgi:glycosyltransferase involved in cell wall biosynthesis
MERKKVLIITYYWPPSGGIGVLRCLKFAKYLRKYGWEPIIYAPEGAEYPYLDDSNFKDIPENLTVIKGGIIEPFSAFKFLSGRKKTSVNNILHVREKQSLVDKLAIWIRGNFFIPDARSLWIKPSVKRLKKYLEENPVDAIFTDGPPHTNTAIGTRLAELTRIPHLADFQDPWTQIDYYKLFKITKWADRKHRMMEQKTFKWAKKITIASPSWKTDLESIGAKNVDVLYYGYDENDFSSLVINPDEKFTVCHSGLLGFDRNPENLFAAIRQLIDEVPLFGEHFKLKLMGQIDFMVVEAIKKYNITNNVDFLGTVSRSQSLQEICGSWMLFLPLNQADNIKGRIPGKFYEYIRAKRPIISLGPDDTDVAHIVNEFGVGRNSPYDDVLRVKQYVEEIYSKFYLLNKFEDVQAAKNIDVFSNENQTKVLAKFLDEMTILK